MDYRNFARGINCQNVMKKYLKIFMVALCAAVSFGLASCHDDKDEPKVDSKDELKGDSLEGTSWIIADSDIDDDMIGTIVTFQKDGNIKFDPEEWAYAKWTQKGDTLRMTVGEEGPDDYMEGWFNNRGEDAVYDYSWYDCDGEYGGEFVYSMYLQKK